MDGQRIKELRVKANLTQVALAEAMSVGQSAVAMWESGQSSPRLSLVPKLAKVLNCSINDLFDACENDERREAT